MLKVQREDDLSLLLSVIKRSNRDFGELSLFLPDRSRLLAEHLATLKRQYDEIDSLVDPVTDCMVQPKINETQLAGLYRRHYSRSQARIHSLCEEILATFVRLTGSLLATHPAVLEETRLVEGLHSIFDNLTRSANNLRESILNVTFKQEFVSDIIKATGGIFESWGSFKAYLRYHIIEPLQEAILNEARRQAFKRLGEILYEPV